MKRYRSLLALLLLAACGDTTDTTPSQLNLDRPTDIAFACYGGLRITNGVVPGTVDEPVNITAQPLGACEIRAGDRGDSGLVPVAPGQEKIDGGTIVPIAEFYAFILQPVRGTVAIAHWEPKLPSLMASGDVTVLDADPLTPGKNSISVGEDPIAIVTDASGCKEVTANAGSCDLSVLDVNSAADTDPAVDVERLEITNALGMPMLARPAAMVVEPNTDQIGFACPATPTGLAYIAYPSCHAVAAVDLSTGIIASSITFDGPGGAAQKHDDGNLDCPAECGDTVVAAPTSGPRPVALDLQVDPRSGRRALAIGAENSSVLELVDLDASFKPSADPQHFPLEDKVGNLGITAVAISPQIGMGGTGGVINDGTGPGGQMQFVYAVTSDHSVRVTEVLSIDKECDTQVDPRLIHGVRNVKQLSCMPVGDPTTEARRPGAYSPGIILPGDGVPTSVAIVRADPINGSTDPPYPSTLVGYFAMITATNGSTFIANVDDDGEADVASTTNPLTTSIPLAIAHQLRDGIPHRGLLATTTGDVDGATICETAGPDPDATGGNVAGSRITATPARNYPTGVLALENIGDLPFIRQVQCTGGDATVPVSELGFSAPADVRALAFPDTHGLRVDETWTLTYEGSLSLDGPDTAIDGPSVRTGMIAVDSNGMHLVDPTRPFCDAGVEEYDIVQLRGCDPVNGDGDCPSGYTCYTHPDSQVSNLGSCMLDGEADRLADACKDYLTSLRRYTVGKSESGEVQLLARTHQLRTTPVDGCVDDNECKQLADYAAQSALSGQPKDTAATHDSHTYTCRVDSLRAPHTGYDGQAMRACVESCTSSSDCVAGAVCENGTCMEGVEPPQACVNSPERYEVRSHEAFTVVGTRSGYVHPIVADANGNCIENPAASPFDLGRIPLIAPACDPTTDPLTGKKPDGTYDANPCQYAVNQVEEAPQFLDTVTCAAANPATALVTRPTTGILFRNHGMQFTVVDPTYPGDAACHGDRGGNLKNVPAVFTGVQLTFRQTAGFSPLLVPIGPSYPVKVVRGPTQSAWVMDEGDFLSTSLTLPSTRGKVFRVEASLPSSTQLLQ